tara:strand:+ start:12146 stop:13348 length:1203 start_codon:yes stop_codon:yes gene_type:complete
MRKTFAVVCITLLVFASDYSKGQEIDITEQQCGLLFDGSLANESVQFQTSLGPRIPGSNSSLELRNYLKSNLSGWEITESNHQINGMNLTNVFATWNAGKGNEVFLAAHYDTRHKADQDPLESNRNKPVIGANDGASGVAVLMELARHIPNMNLSHEVTLFFTDAEDQGDNHSTYVIGAKAWADNLTQTEADSIESFILVDMVGDEYLNLRKTRPGNDTLWNRVEGIILDLEEICEQSNSDYFDFENVDGIYDDHVPAHEKGIPAIDIIDTRYGEGAGYLGGYWHTIEDTPDKVSAESLQKVGHILEYGLRNGSWLGVRSDSNAIIEESNNLSENNCTGEYSLDNKNCLDRTNVQSDSNIPKAWILVPILFAYILTIIIILIKNNADNKGRGEIRAPPRQ